MPGRLILKANYQTSNLENIGLERISLKSHISEFRPFHRPVRIVSLKILVLRLKTPFQPYPHLKAAQSSSVGISISL